MSYRIGIGYDIHRTIEGRKLFIGGVEIPHAKGLEGHSDADVLIHALCDALLGAIGNADIGEMFPDSEPQYKGISSAELLRLVNNLVKKKNFIINNIDTVVVAESPNLSPFKQKMRLALALILNIEPNLINIKCKTNEGLGEIGRHLAIAAWAAAIVSGED